mmetsp:Transcript_82962/g.230438  ORF Transcript_82962/g.230438 Transcript_82962/m.230438 type:complete len:530 (-) Transcript_82962:315-1904(-)
MPESSGSVLKFTGITHAGKAGQGAFKLNEQQLGWACTEGVPGQVGQVAFLGRDVAAAEWQRVCGKGKALLKLRFKGNAAASRFAGFRQEDFPALRDHFKTYFGTAVVEQPVSTKGCSWFNWSLEGGGGHELRLLADGKAGIDVPLADLSQVSTLGKNELNLEFQEDPFMAPGDEAIHEMRLFMPSGDVAPEFSVDQLRDELQKRTGLSATGEALARIPDIAVVQPRGKHDFEFFRQAVKVHGKTQTYTVKYASIARTFLLELPNESAALVLHLDQPLRQGQQMHSFLVLTFDKERRIVVELPEDMHKTLNMKAGEEHEVHSVVAKLVKHLAQKSLIAPTTEFSKLLQDGNSCVRCSNKTQPGFLFPMRRSMIFIPRPVIWIRYEEIEGIEFKSSQMRKSSFDLLVHLKRQQVVEFSQLERGRVLEAVFTFFQNMEVRIANPDEVQSWITPSTTRGKQPSAAPAARPSGSAGSASSKEKPEDTNQEEEGEDDEDYEDAEDGDEDESSAEEEDDEPDEEEEPKKKRAKRAR